MARKEGKLNSTVNRRDLLRSSVAGVAWAMSRFPLSAFGFAEPDSGEELLPFVDPPPIVPGHVAWNRQPDWLTAAKDTFVVSHYGPAQLDAEKWKLEIAGFVERPLALSLADLKARPKREYTATLECSGNGAGPKFLGAVANNRWTGTPLAPILHGAGVKPEGIEVVFFSADQGQEKIRDQEYPQSFARSLALSDAMSEHVLLAYAMNGESLTQGHGAPVRLVVPGWYGVAWVKWLARIELADRRFMNRFMGRDYVTIRGQQVGDKAIWRETSVGRMNVKSIIAQVVKKKDGTLRVSGAAWTDLSGVKAVEVQIDGGAWMPAELENKDQGAFSWTFFHFDWKDAKPGEHTLVSRAIDHAGRTQPAKDDALIKLKKTYWEANEQFPRKIKV